MSSVMDRVTMFLAQRLGGGYVTAKIAYVVLASYWYSPRLGAAENAGLFTTVTFLLLLYYQIRR